MCKKSLIKWTKRWVGEKFDENKPKGIRKAVRPRLRSLQDVEFDH
jgi:hypothetical protein